jgi:hypothetical protein
MIKLKQLLLEMGAWIDNTSKTDEIVTMDKINNFIQTLSTDDIGQKQFENYIICFEGFTDNCWQDADKCNKTEKDLEDELLTEWEEKLKKENSNEKIEFKEANWAGDIFYAIFILGGIGSLNETNKSTLAVRRYYKRHPAKVRAYLKATQNDRVKRNAAHRKAVKKHGAKFMKNKDVHHLHGINSKTRIVKSKNHGPDKKK